jgi:putative hydrolase of the HAD superfamily
LILKKYLIWDFDGTLAWRPEGWSGVLAQVLRQSEPQASVTAEQIRPYLQAGFPWHAPENPHPGMSPQDWWEDMLPLFARTFRAVGVAAARAAVLAREVQPVYTDPGGWQVFPDARPTLAALSERGWSHILLSNHVPELPALLAHLDLTTPFAAVFNSAQTGCENPIPKPFTPLPTGLAQTRGMGDR